MTLMALMLEITTRTGTTTMELSVVAMVDENRVSPHPQLMASVGSTSESTTPSAPHSELSWQAVLDLNSGN